MLPSPAAPSASWSDLEPLDWECGARDLIAAADVAHRRAQERAAALAESQLWEPAVDHGPLAGFSNAEVVAQCLILHPSWHLGQLALIPRWRRLGKAPPPTPAAPSHREVLSPCGDWSFHMPPVATRRELLLEVLRQAQTGCPWHGFERTLVDVTDEEATWRRAGADSDDALSIWFYCLHVATCDVIYAETAFGERRNDWHWAGKVVGADDGPPSAEACLTMSRRGHEFLLARLAEASDEQLEAVHEMHHGHDMAGWQVIAAMVQHRPWHGGQIALMRDAYAGVG